MLFGGEEKIEFEGIDAQDNRYYISKREGSSHELSNNFPSNLLLNALENYKQKILPLDTKDPMYTAIITLIKHN
ncbi:unnamed protein product [Rhizophagus irregularis]|nr:unnamed protein product [Rhizophagus irregularis]